MATATRWIERVKSRYQEEPSQPVRWRLLQHDQIAAEFERLQGRSDPERWARLVAGCAENGFRYDEALARYHRAAALLAGTQRRASEARKAAGAELARAGEIATELCAAPLLAEIDGLARRARLSVDPTTPVRHEAAAYAHGRAAIVGDPVPDGTV